MPFHRKNVDVSDTVLWRYIKEPKLTMSVSSLTIARALMQVLSLSLTMMTYALVCPLSWEGFPQDNVIESKVTSSNVRPVTCGDSGGGGGGGGRGEG